MTGLSQLQKLKDAVEKELCENILPYWLTNVVDHQHGGFYGYIDQAGVVKTEAPKGCILHSRILWTFSRAYLQYRDEKYLEMAQRAYHYLLRYFWDTEHEGLYWLVDYQGSPWKEESIYTIKRLEYMGYLNILERQGKRRVFKKRFGSMNLLKDTVMISETKGILNHFQALG